MAGKQAIEAGSAFIRLFLKDGELIKGLKSWQPKLQALGHGMATAGGVLVAAGAAIAAPLAASVRQFTVMGSALNDMADRTGVAVNELSFLKYAAEQTGASLEDVEAAIRNLEKKGINPSNLTRIAEELRAIPDPARRAAKSLDLFGKTGTKLLPMMLNLRGLREEFTKLGISVSPEEAAAADRLGDAFDRLGSVLQRTMFSIGVALEPIWTPFLETMTAVAVAVAKFAKEHKTLFQVLAVSAVALIVVGTALAALGLIIVKVVAIGTALVTLFTFLAGYSAVLIPLAVVLAMIVATLASFAAWLMFTREGQKAIRGLRLALNGLAAGFLKMTKDIRAAFKGVGDAIAAGEIELAWQILLAGMTAQWDRFIAKVFRDLALYVELMEDLALGPAGGALARGMAGDESLPAILRELARGATLDADLKALLIKRLSAQAAGMGGGSESSYVPGGGMTRGAHVIGTNARAALMSGNIMATARNPVVDTIVKMIEQEKKNTAWLELIARRGGRGMR